LRQFEIYGIPNWVRYLSFIVNVIEIYREMNN